MVYYYRSTGSDKSFESDPRFVYMGKDKFENDDLIKYGFEEDVWFHVEKFSSAHVYLRLQPGEKWDKLPHGLLTDCAQLSKANSIQACKKDNITITYTPWSNLKKTKGMAEGEVGFKSPKKVKRFVIQTKENDILNRLKKTREEIIDKKMLVSAKNNKDKNAVQKVLDQRMQQREEEAEEKQMIIAMRKKMAKLSL